MMRTVSFNPFMCNKRPCKLLKTHLPDELCPEIQQMNKISDLKGTRIEVRLFLCFREQIQSEPIYTSKTDLIMKKKGKTNSQVLELLLSLSIGVGGRAREEFSVERVVNVVDDELRDGREVTVTLVTDGGILVVTGEEEEGGEATNVVGGINIVLSGIDLGNDDRVNLGEGRGDLLVEGSEGLAVTAPGSVELDEDVLSLILDDGIKVLVDESLDVRFSVLLRDGLRATEGIAGASDTAVDELSNRLSVELLLLVESVEGGLIVLPSGEDHGRITRSRGTPLGSQVGVGLNGSLQEVDVLIDREGVGNRASELKSVRAIVEEHGHGALGSSDARDEGLVQDERLELGGGLLSDVSGEGINSNLIRVDSGDLVSVEENDGSKLLLNLLGQFSRSNTSERILSNASSLGNLVEDGSILTLSGEQDDASKRITLKEGIEGSLIVDGDDGRLSLLSDPLLQSLGVTLSSVGDGLTSLPVNGQC